MAVNNPPTPTMVPRNRRRELATRSCCSRAAVRHAPARSIMPKPPLPSAYSSNAGPGGTRAQVAARLRLRLPKRWYAPSASSAMSSAKASAKWAWTSALRASTCRSQAAGESPGWARVSHLVRVKKTGQPPTSRPNSRSSVSTSSNRRNCWKVPSTSSGVAPASTARTSASADRTASASRPRAFARTAASGLARRWSAASLSQSHNSNCPPSGPADGFDTATRCGVNSRRRPVSGPTFGRDAASDPGAAVAMRTTCSCSVDLPDFGGPKNSTRGTEFAAGGVIAVAATRRGSRRPGPRR